MKDTTNQSRARERVWTVLCEQNNGEREEVIEALSRALGVTKLTARILAERGYTTPEAAELFLGNDERVWHDPMQMKDMERAVERTLRAVRAGERIAVYGDYDVDGVTSLSSLYLYLTSLGAEVTCYIPNRATEGYGMSIDAVRRLAEAGVTLIITVDTGITARDEIAYADSMGVDTVVTDHHECHAELPDCAAVVNPHRPDCPYPFKELAGVGVVFKFLCACEAVRAAVSPIEALDAVGRQFMDLVAIGTIADVMPLDGENRFIVSRGLAMLNCTERPGLAALLDAISGSGQTRSAADGHGKAYKKPRRKVNSGLVGFGIAPRINAAGRVAHAMQAVELLLADDPDRAAVLAEELCEINTRRQAEENRIAEQALSTIEAQIAADAAEGRTLGNRILVLENDDWMQGVVGIVASRLTEKYGLPSILISFDGAVAGYPSEDDIGKGSGRSVKGMNLVDALSFCEDLLVRFGGHELAAGLTVRRRDIPAFRERINEYAATHLTDEMTAVCYEADLEVTTADLTMEQARELERLEPFGVGNQTPVFLLRDVIVQRIIPLGAGKHTKLLLMADGMSLQAVWFGTSPARLPVVAGDRADVLFQLNINDYQGVQSLQLVVQDLRVAESYTAACRAAHARFEEILGGGAMRSDEGSAPDRDDVARVFTILRRDARAGLHTISEREITARLADGGCTSISPVKLRLIFHIMGEMGVCRVEELDGGVFVFEVNFDAPKTSVEASPLFCSLRCRPVRVL